MRKFTLISAILLSAVFGSFGQKKIDLDNFWVKMIHRIPPSRPESPLFFDYVSVVNANSSTASKVSTSDLQARMNIEGQRKVDAVSENTYTFRLTLGSFVVKNNNILERREEIKNKEGAVTGYNYFYKVEVNYTFESEYQILKDGKVVVTRTISSPSTTKTFTSSEYSSRSAAQDYWQNNRENFIADQTQQLVNSALSTANGDASQLFGFYVESSNEKLQITDEPKHPENEAFRAACNFVKDKAQNITPNVGLTENEMAGTIDYFKNIPTKYTDPKGKADVRLRYAAYYNLARIYLFLDQPEKTKEYANLLITNDYDPKDGEKLIKDADKLAADLKKMPNGKSYFNPQDYWGR